MAWQRRPKKSQSTVLHRPVDEGDDDDMDFHHLPTSPPVLAHIRSGAADKLNDALEAQSHDELLASLSCPCT